MCTEVRKNIYIKLSVFYFATCKASVVVLSYIRISGPDNILFFLIILSAKLNGVQNVYRSENIIQLLTVHFSSILTLYVFDRQIKTFEIIVI
jgi:hypothetical protein